MTLSTSPRHANKRLSGALQQCARVVNWFLVSGPDPDPELRVRHFFCLFGRTWLDTEDRYQQRKLTKDRERRLQRDEARVEEEAIRAAAARVEAERAQAAQAEEARQVELNFSEALCNILLQIHDELQRTA